MSSKQQVSIGFTPQEIDWMNNYAGNKDLTLEATLRHALRALSLLEGTPGAWDAVNALSQARLGPKSHDPMPPLPPFAPESRDG